MGTHLLRRLHLSRNFAFKPEFRLLARLQDGGTPYPLVAQVFRGVFSAFETRERIIGNLLWCGLGLIAACGAVALGGYRGRWGWLRGIFSDSSGRDYPCFDQQTAPREAESVGDKPRLSKPKTQAPKSNLELPCPY
jgi:hypothetical protein